MENILVPIDFSEVTERVIQQAVLIAQAFTAHLWLIHVAAPDPDFVGYEVGPQHERDWRAEKLQQEHQWLQEKADQIQDEGEGIEVTALLMQGKTVNKILEKATEIQADLIVVGSHGHRIWYSALMGSVSKKLLREAVCPLLIVPAHEK